MTKVLVTGATGFLVGPSPYAPHGDFLAPHASPEFLLTLIKAHRGSNVMRMRK